MNKLWYWEKYLSELWNISGLLYDVRPYVCASPVLPNKYAFLNEDDNLISLFLFDSSGLKDIKSSSSWFSNSLGGS